MDIFDAVTAATNLDIVVQVCICGAVAALIYGTFVFEAILEDMFS